MYEIPKFRAEDIIIYLRKSRADDPLETVEETLAKHEREIDAYLLRAHGLKVPDELRMREVVSGESLDSRPEMLKLLSMVEDPRVKAVACVEPERLSRGDYEDIGRLVRILRYTGTLVITPQFTYDLQDERDRSMFVKDLEKGNFYYEYSRKIMRRGRDVSVSQGHYIGPVAPYGYRKISYKEGNKKVHTLEPHPEEAPAVKIIFEMYAQGYGTVAICDRLEEEHFRPRQSKTWKATTITSILKNEHYIGKVRWDRRANVRTIENGKTKISRPNAKEYQIVDGLHQPLIDQETWDKVQSIRAMIPPSSKRQTELRNPLAGIMRCSCGRMMAWKQVVRRGVVLGVPRFMCGDIRCRANSSATVEEVMEEVIETLKGCIEDYSLRIEKKEDDAVKRHEQKIARLQKHLGELKELEIKQWDEKTRGGMPGHIFAKLNDKTVKEMEEVSQALEIAKRTAPQSIDYQERITTFHKTVDLLCDPDAPAKEKNQMLKLCIEQVIYSRPNTKTGAGKKAPFHLDFTLRV